MGIFYGILSVPQNNVMNPYNVMIGLSLIGINFVIFSYISFIEPYNLSHVFEHLRRVLPRGL